ncbi:MAG TPA: YajQ family cyclic di-GMP-binding protein [Chloroflexota bacterium]|nr:YajQ family cyclic di-GMP-binding protein [Chloroflexota bacterium]
MAGDFSFDVVSQFDRQELVNAVDQTKREIATRYDFKGTKAGIELEKDALELTGDSDFQLKSVKDVLESKAIRRGLSLKIFEYGMAEPAAGSTVRQKVSLKAGISDDLSRKITKLVRDKLPKVKTQVQGDAIRVSSKSKDELQGVIQLLKEQDYPVPLQFINYR